MDALQLIQNCDRIIRGRSQYENVWQDIIELVRPNTTDMHGNQTIGAVRTNKAYDGTAIASCNQLASGLHSYLVNPVERWFTLGLVGADVIMPDEDALAWLEVVSDIIYQVFGQAESNFTTAMHEGMLDLAAFGTSCPYQEFSQRKNTLTFKAMPMADVFFKEDCDDLINTVVARRIWTVEQLAEEFELTPELKRKKPDQPVTILHYVTERINRIPGRVDKKNKKYASYWLCLETKELLEEGGYDTFPYHGGRWMKLADEVYGIGPAKNALPDIKLLNAMEKNLIKAAEKITDPPLQVPDDGFMLPIATSPGALIMKEANAPLIEPLIINGQIPWSLELANQKREAIRQAFHADWLRMEKENKEMTAYEVADRRNEKLVLIAPMMGRIQREQLDTLLKRAYSLLYQRGYFPPAPPSLQRRKLTIAYVSPAARAQFAIKANEIGRYITELTPLIQIYPDVMDAVDFDKLAKKLAEFRSMSRQVLRSDAEIKNVRAQRAEMRQVQQLAEVAEPASKAMKNVADAQSKGLNLESFIQ